MGAPKGSRNAKAYHDEHTKKCVNEIRSVLKSMINSGLVVRNITALSNYVANQIKTSSVTLRRNLVYRELLENHLVRQRGAATILSDRDRQIASLRAKMKVLELDLANTKADKKRLESRVRLVDERPAVGMPKRKEIPPGKDSADFESTAYLVLAILERIDGLEIDEKNEVIIDRAAPPNNQIIVGPAYCRPFIKWLKKRSPEDGSS